MSYIDDILFDRDTEITRGVKTNKVKDDKECPICHCKEHIMNGTNKVFMCGTIIDTTKLMLTNKCYYNKFEFYKDNSYEPSKHYYPFELEDLGIEITGVCMYHKDNVPLDLQGKHFKIYEKDNYLNLKGGNLVGSALVQSKNATIKKAVKQYIKDYNNIVVDKNVWSWDVVDSDGKLIDRLMGFYGNVLEQAKEFMSEYSIYKEDLPKFWEQRLDN